MNNTLLRPWLAVLLASWMMVACGGGGSALGVGGSSSSSTTTAIVGGDSPSNSAAPLEASAEVPTCTSASTGFIVSEDDLSFNIDYSAKTLTEFLDGNEGQVFSFDLKLDANQNPVACTFTVQMNGAARDFSLVEEKIHWLP